jgi:hypothetical protein
MAQSNRKKRCGKCRESGRSIRTSPQMKAVTAARLTNPVITREDVERIYDQLVAETV